jgi:putative Holliday junction resolvase
LAPVRTFLAFDFGERRIGVAVGNSLTGSAEPLAAIASVPLDARFGAIARLIAQWRPDALVVGRPLLPDGAPGPLTPRCERFARQLAGRHGLPVHQVDERYSSVEAQADGARGDAIDPAAAAIILRQYLADATLQDARPPR